MGSKLKKKEIIFVIALTIIPVIQFCIFYIGVNINSFILPFQKYVVNDGQGRFVFLPFDDFFVNFERFFNELKTDVAMQATAKNSVKLFFWGSVVMFPIHILVSYSIYKKLLFSRFFMTMLYIPNIISGIVFVIVFKYFIEKGLPVAFNNDSIANLLSNPSTAFNTLLVFSLWLGFGSGLVLYVGAMARIPESIIEYGKLEGITALREVWSVVIPMIFPTITAFIITSFVSLFTSQFVLVSFYGTTADPTLQTFGYYFFIKVIGNNATSADYPYAAACALIFTVIITPIVMFVKFVLEKYGPNPEY